MPTATGKHSDKNRQLRGVRSGVVVSDKRDKTRTVMVEKVYQHPKYGKNIRLRKKYHVHDAHNESHNGDRVEFANCRPISKSVSSRLLRVVKKAP